MNFTSSETFCGVDPEVQELIALEKKRQEDKIILIASESYCHPAVKEVLSCDFTNLYAEGYPAFRQINGVDEFFSDWDYHLAYQNRYGDRRYYKGCEFANLVEALAIKRLQKLWAEHSKPDFPFKAEQIFCNVQSLSGAAANNAIYTAFVPVGGKVMGLSLNHGGHLTHGSPVNRSGKNYQIIPYEIDLELGRLNYDKIREKAHQEKPQMIIAGFSAYPLDICWKELRNIANEVGAYLLADISHNAGFILTGDFPNPLGHAHIISFTTHKTLCGPRGAAIVCTEPALAKKIDFAVFPGEQGGPHINNIAAKAVAFQLAATEEFHTLQKNILNNAKVLCEELTRLGLKLSLKETHSHLLLIDLKSVTTPTGIPLKGEIVARILDAIGITCNKNTIPGDSSALNPSAIRLGTTMISQLGFQENHTRKLAQIIHHVLTSIHTYIGNDRVTRGKVEFSVLQSATKEVQKLLCELQGKVFNEGTIDYSSPLKTIHESAKAKFSEQGLLLHYGNIDQENNAAEHSTLIKDGCHLKVIEVSGEKAPYFLNEVFSANLLLKPGESCSAVALDAEGKVLATPSILRLTSLSHHRSRYLLVVRPEEKENLLQWLHFLSASYVLFDTQDLYANVTGPVIIREQKLGMIALEGARVEALLKEEFSWFEPLFPNNLKEQGELILHRHLFQEGRWNYELFFPLTQAESIWTRLFVHASKYSTVRGGSSRLNTLWKNKALPEVGFKLDETQQKHWLCFVKPYAIGRKNYPAPTAEYERFFWEEPKEVPLKETCLISFHKEHTAKRNLVPFGGWLMPVQYNSIVEEHKVVRTKIGLFDVAHMGTIKITGEHSVDFLELLTSNSVNRLTLKHCCYSYLLDASGNVIDDILVYRLDWKKFMLVVNASNHDKVMAWIRAVASGKMLLSEENTAIQFNGEVHIEDLKDPSSGADQLVDIALQGPKTMALLCKLAQGDFQLEWQFRAMTKNSFLETSLHGIPLIVSRTGYTGEEFGVEFYVHPEKALTLWNLLLQEGAEWGIQPCGLGARDSTRTEAGFPLYGHELAGEHNISPVEAGYVFFTKFHKPFFIGRSKMIAQYEKEERAVVRFKILEWGKNLNPGDPIVDQKGQYRGRVTSATIVQNEQIGLAIIDARVKAKGTALKFFPLSHKTFEAETPKDKMGGKDKVLLPLSGEILSRFADFSKQKA